MERVSPFVAQPATPSWRRAALIFAAALATVALATHVIAVSGGDRDCEIVSRSYGRTSSTRVWWRRVTLTRCVR